MGISKSVAALIIKEAKRSSFSGSLCTLGKNDIWFTYSLLKRIAKKEKFKLNRIKNIRLSTKRSMANKKYISDITFFKSLFFRNIESLDVSNYENASIIFDLNKPKLPKKLENRFDNIIDAGTMEHVFHLPNMLNNLFKMLKPHGRIIHILPSSNHMDHGFFMFSPTFFYDFYSINGFYIRDIKILKYKIACHDTFNWKFSTYRPKKQNYSNLDKSQYAIFCVTEKLENSTGTKIPTQGIFTKEWIKSQEKPLSGIKQKLKNNKKVYTLYLKLLKLRVKIKETFPFIFNLNSPKRRKIIWREI